MEQQPCRVEEFYKSSSSEDELDCSLGDKAEVNFGIPFAAKFKSIVELIPEEECGWQRTKSKLDSCCGHSSDCYLVNELLRIKEWWKRTSVNSNVNTRMN